MSLLNALALAALLLLPQAQAQAQAQAQYDEEAPMTATGTFEVKLEPQADKQAPAGRMLMNKRYSGDLEATATGQMISKRTEKGASAYAAVEEVQGTLGGKTGAFTLIHNGYMDATGQTLEVIVLPGSGSGQLEGLTGTMEIIIEDGDHRYVLNYSL